MDYEKIAVAAIQAVKTADLNRFLVVCALVSDLYCPGYNAIQTLAKDSKLASTAARYKINRAKLATSVREELRNTKRKSANESVKSAKHDCKAATRKSQKRH